ncbi:hypothetical protein [Bacillus sinesaloumensis]|nr:hypothetical protein [Bacillus sinesaloumensis]
MRIGGSAADAEICRSSEAGDRTWKLSFSADGSWGIAPVRVGRR